MVTKVMHRKSGDFWACKEVQKERAGSSGIAMLELEIAVLKQLAHPHVVSMHEVFETPKVRCKHNWVSPPSPLQFPWPLSATSVKASAHPDSFALPPRLPPRSKH